MRARTASRASAGPHLALAHGHRGFRRRAVRHERAAARFRSAGSHPRHKLRAGCAACWRILERRRRAWYRRGAEGSAPGSAGAVSFNSRTPDLRAAVSPRPQSRNRLERVARMRRARHRRAVLLQRRAAWLEATPEWRRSSALDAKEAVLKLWEGLRRRSTR